MSGMGVLAIGGLIGMLFSGVPLLSRFLNQDMGTLNGRTLLWQFLLDNFDPKQLLGHGLDASTQLLTEKPVLIEGGMIATAPSNLFIGTLFDHGIIGLGLLLLLLTALCVSLIRGVRRTTGEQRILFGVALAVTVSVVLQLLEQDDLWSRAIGVYFWIIMALPFSRCWDSREELSNEALEEISEKPASEALEEISGESSKEDNDPDDMVTNAQIEVPWWLQKKRDPLPTDEDRPRPLRY